MSFTPQQAEAIRQVAAEKRRQGEKLLADLLTQAAATIARMAAPAATTGTHTLPAPQATASLYKQFEAQYHAFCKRQLGAPGKMDGAQGKALHGIIDYLTQVATTKDAAGALSSWQYILSNWDCLSDFMQKQRALTSINKNLMEIIDTIRKAKAKEKPEAKPADLQAKRRLEKLQSELEEATNSLNVLRNMAPYAQQAEHLRQAEARIDVLTLQIEAYG